MSRLPADTHWAVQEFADAELGDPRRMQRLVELATALARHPTAFLPEACGTSAMLKAAYRFFSNDAIEPHDLLHRHIEATYSRLAQVPLVLTVPEPCGDRPRVLVPGWHAPWQSVSSRRRVRHRETRMPTRSHYR